MGIGFGWSGRQRSFDYGCDLVTAIETATALATEPVSTGATATSTVPWFFLWELVRRMLLFYGNLENE